jgi:deoxyribodipyrimidine photo-lyase
MPSSVQREAGCLIGRDYPAPVVDHATAFREAREQIAAIRRRPDARTEADEIQRRHGSRRSGLPPTTTPGSRRGGPSTAAAGSRGRRSKDTTAAAASGQQSLWAEVDAPAGGPAGTAS